MSNLSELIKPLLETIQTDKKGLVLLKNTAVRCKQFELAASLREMQTKNFPETDEEKESKKQGYELNLLFRMVELNISEDICWLIGEALKNYKTKKGKFNLEDAVKLVAKRKQIFDVE